MTVAIQNPQKKLDIAYGLVQLATDAIESLQEGTAAGQLVASNKNAAVLLEIARESLQEAARFAPSLTKELPALKAAYDILTLQAGVAAVAGRPAAKGRKLGAHTPA